MVSYIGYEVVISIHFLYTEEDKENENLINNQSISIHFLYTEEDTQRQLIR